MLNLNLFNTDTNELSELDENIDPQYLENFPGEVDFIYKKIDQVLESRDIARGYVKDGARCFICPIDRDMLTYGVIESEGVILKDMENCLIPQSTINLARNVYKEKTDHVVAVLSFLYGDPEKKERAWYVCSSSIENVEKNYKKYFNKAQGFG